MNFSDFEFDEALKLRLDSLYSQNRQPHAIVIEGADEEKCEQLSTFLTMRAVCRAENKPCGKCEQCIKAKEQAHPDIYYAQPEKKSQIYSIEQMRDIIENASIRPNEADIKIFVFRNAEKRLLPVVQNSFLKLLEEPPQNCLFLLLCKNSRGLLNTILSRCTVITVKGDESFGEEAISLAKAIAEGTVAPSEWQLLSAFSGFTDRKLADETLAVLTVIFRDCVAVSRGIKARIDAELAIKLGKRITTGMALQLVEATEQARQKILQNVNMDLLSAFLSGEYRRIIWQR
mgnify:CR=1 FL=1